MRESRTYGSVRGALRNERPYREPRRTLAISAPISEWSLTSLKEPLVKIGAKVVSHGRYVAFQMTEVAVPRTLFADPAGTTGEVHLDDGEIGFAGPECACDIGIRAWRCPWGGGQPCR